MARLVVISALVALALVASPAGADPVNCQKQIIKNLLKFKKTDLKALGKCADNENLGKITGPCPDAATLLKISKVKTAVHTKISDSCPDPDRTTLGFPTSCAFEPGLTGAAEQTCASMPVTSAGDLADCLMCWKGAELAEFVATLYASHATEICGGALDDTSTVCSDLDCATPLPVQRDLGNTGENDCQKAIGKGGIKHLVAIEKAYEKCGLLGSDQATCTADLSVQASIQKAQLKLQTLIKNKCGNRAPVPNPPFCCRTGMMNQCTAAADRTDCTTNLGGTVKEGKTCGLGGTCDPVMGPNQKITWWSTCPQKATCTGDNLTLDDLISCVDQSAQQISAELLCLQFPSGWTCPPDASPSGAFLD
jgi:hypothetical protein